MKWRNLLCSIAFLFTAAPAVRGESPATQPSFMRFVEEKNGPSRLEVATVTYRNDDGVSVSLIGAIHIADPAYYRGLDESFDHYDALLYELVKAKDGPATPTKGQQSTHWIGRMQQFMKNKLGLVYQLDEIDYDKPNFVHADMNWEEFSQAQDEKGENMFMLSLKSALHGTGDMDPSINGFTMLGALASPDSEYQLKFLMARMFSQAGGPMDAMADDTVIITERNKAALKVLKEQIDAGKKNIGIFYGAGHLKTMEKSMMDEMGFKKIGTVWRTAWDLGMPPVKKATTTQPKKLPSTQPAK